ncbi:putative Thioesterase/thiol ester dehydrase-isomerase [Dinoroseobacter shibae DFL 12 = DSM 16493]|jgi:acyl-CoA thioester hydrolase|uniref:Putative Thioesterase/thiol ester dehydrase-isomerase n=1 Tax=Dinoroseobacter shibae (strain DSM 16493 / NCIMB 14021 / DFL 12) TaxID=398580 RepID=A8LLP5_DINSH|nr:MULTISPECIES: thioesterase family protein [Dinoroseobacter]ABV93423.1 putative Thioesterase/thiol ester dehydrase-isomerase [Dinoroseobacter shibae DFL 12 = DSM 16493]MDD9715482.1 thioesterase family protein [Dinoroseobacter sp. PD6]URF48337.1 acyl-CoA thioesterase [Dinoroseobacter shibae]URF52647.1 acyl-CoA thioesterase [Dinoroseobacter shibae]
MTDPAKPTPLTPLLADDLRAAGVPEPWNYGMADRVRFHEIDALNHVNNAVCFSWFENLRVHYLRDYGIYRYTPEDPMLVMRAVGASYNAPLFLGQDYILTARTRSFGRTSFVMDYGAFCDGAFAIEGHAVIVLVEQDGRTGYPLTDEMRAIMASRDGATLRQA